MSTRPTHPFNNDATPAERRERSTTYKSFASAFADETKGGRYAKSDSGPTIKPLPPNSPWSSSQPQPGDEPPLGYDINAVPDLGFNNEQKSVAQAEDKLLMNAVNAIKSAVRKKSVAQAPASPPAAVEPANGAGEDSSTTPAPTISQKETER